MLKALSSVAPKARRRNNCLTRALIEWLCVVYPLVMKWFIASRLRTDNDSGRPLARCHPLTLLSPPSRLRASAGDRVCVCLHALSSFQRTDRSCALGARPTFLPARRRRTTRRLGYPLRVPLPSNGAGEATPHCRDAARLGEPSKVTSPVQDCQPEFWPAKTKKLLRKPFSATFRRPGSGFRALNVQSV
jgi:hypothetical protein